MTNTEELIRPLSDQELSSRIALYLLDAKWWRDQNNIAIARQQYMCALELVASRPNLELLRDFVNAQIAELGNA